MNLSTESTEDLHPTAAAEDSSHNVEARVTLLERAQAAPEVGALFDTLMRERGVVPNMFKALAQVPVLALGVAAFAKAVLETGHLTAAYKQLVASRVALLHGCDYCISAHRLTAYAAGATKEQIEGLAEFEEGPFSEKEKAGFRFADALHSSAHAIDDAQSAAVREYFQEPELLELTAVAAAFEFFPRLVQSLAIPVTPVPESAPAFLHPERVD